MDVGPLRRAVLAWYDANRRELPWRGVDDPYAVWVSEVMLQQTRTATAAPYFLRWMVRFPNVHALAAAPEEDVLRLWSGLGYYSRARAMHRAARAVVDEHEGRLPDDPDRLRALPGIGPYTAGAVASIAFGVRAPAVDGNVVRVLARWALETRDPARPEVRRELEAQAAALVPKRRPGDWNQALMELGATVCVPRNPRCDACPVRAHCAAHAEQRTHEVPVRRQRPVPPREDVQFALVTRGGKVLVVPGNATGLLAGLWALPGGAPGDLGAVVQEQTGLRVRFEGDPGRADHRFTHRHWRIAVHPAAVVGGRLAQGPRWVPIDALADQAMATAHRKAVAAGLAARDRIFLSRDPLGSARIRGNAW